MKTFTSHKTSPGAASILTVVIIAIVITVLVIGLVRIMIGEQRQSTDDALSARAYYAAESGLEDARSAVRQYVAGDITTLPDGSNCDAEDAASGADNQLAPDPIDAEIVCQAIITEVKSLEFQLEHNETVQYVLNDEYAGFTHVRISWAKKGHETADYSGDINVPEDTSGTCRKGMWQNYQQWRSDCSFPMAIKAHLFEYASGSNRDSINNNAALLYLRPHSSAGSSLNVVSKSANSFASNRNPNYTKSAVNTRCDSSVDDGEYICSQTISAFGDTTAKKVFLRLTGIYAKNHVKVEVLSGMTNPVVIPNQQAIVDVTGRAGDIYRRVQSRVDLNGNSAVNVPDDAVTANGICKDYSITDDATEFHSINNNNSDKDFCVSIDRNLID